MTRCSRTAGFVDTPLSARPCDGSLGAQASALRRAAAARGEHEKRIGREDAYWPDWYAQYMVSEQIGAEPPK
ncbi:hypothetical protein [Streptomyces sp. NPDC056291]|uniref:hypothetical protein n=1 Tax=unclassified Streptomyces TaxID=2593676 RepID=UPI0035D5A400